MLCSPTIDRESVIQRETKDTIREEVVNVRWKRKSIISRVKPTVRCGQLSWWNFVAKTTCDSSVRRCRVSVPRAVPSDVEGIVVVIVGDSEGKKETRWRRHYRYLISWSLARPAMPLESVVYVLICSLRVRRVEPEIVPTRFCNDEWGDEEGSRFEVFL